MKKIRLTICTLIALSQIMATDQQLSKKMGSHVNGERYKGSYKNGLKHGHGIWTHPDGDSYKGKFKSGLKRGRGTYTFENGEKYRGYYKRDQQHGLGQYTYNNGETSGTRSNPPKTISTLWQSSKVRGMIVRMCCGKLTYFGTQMTPKPDGNYPTNKHHKTPCIR